MEKRWRCTVCGYVHRGESPPQVCPVCGVGAEKFELLDEEGEADSAPAAPPGLFQEMMQSFMPHAVLAHFPNALLPTLGLFLLLFLLGIKTLDHGIYLLLGILPPAVIATFSTGIYSWRKHYDGAKSRIFHRKLIFGVALILISCEMLLLRFNNPQLLVEMGVSGWFFLILCGAAIFCVTMLGHYGGMLVFGRIEMNRGHFD